MIGRKKRERKKNLSILLIIVVFVIALFLFLRFNNTTGNTVVNVFSQNGVDFGIDSGTNPLQEYVTFTSAKTGTSKQLAIISDNDSSTTKIKPILAYYPSRGNTGFLIHVKENERALQYDWIVLNKNDLGMIVLYEVFAPAGNIGTLTLTDVIRVGMTGAQQKITLTKSGNDYINNNAEIFGVSGYKIKVTIEDNKLVLYISWNSGTTALYPRIKLANGGWITFLQDTYILNGENLILPNNKATLDSSGSVYSATGNKNNIFDDGMVWLYDRAVSGINHVWGVNTSSGICNFSATKGPALLIIKSNSFTCIPQTFVSSGSNTYISIGSAQTSNLINYCKGNGFSCSNSNECCSKHCIQGTRGIWYKVPYSECG